jgi:hypothetical protein
MVNLDFLYDSEDDILYISFAKDRRGMILSLNDYVVLIFDPATAQAKGLTIMNYAYLLQHNVSPPISRLDEFPTDIRNTAWRVLNSSPVDKYLRLQEPSSMCLVERVTLPDLLLAA